MNKIIVAALVLSNTGIALSADHYVRAGASGASTGSDWTDAFTALPSTLVRGDTYYIADGTYGAYEFKTANAGSAVIYIKKATTTDHGTESGWAAGYGDGEALFSSPGTVWQFGPGSGYYVISGQKGIGNAAGSYGFRLYSSASRNSASALLKSNTGGTFSQTGNHVSVTLQYIDFDWNNGSAAGASGATRAIEFNSANYNPDFTVSHCYVHHSSGFGFYLGSIGSNLTVDNCCFEANGGSTVYHHETLWITDLNGLVFSNNVITDTKAGALTGWLMLGSVGNARIYNNIFTCSDPASSVYSCGGNGIIATWDNNTYQNSNIEIIHNSFVDLPTNGSRAIYFHHSGGADDGNVVCRNNLYYNSGFGWTGVDVQSNEACGGGQGCAGTSQQTGVASAIFIDYAAEDFRLSAGTAPGINTVYTVDRLGGARGVDGTIDRGAYEYASGTTPVASVVPQPPKVRNLMPYALYDISGRRTGVMTAEGHAYASVPGLYMNAAGQGRERISRKIAGMR